MAQWQIQDYPLPRFHFQVDWGGAKISFTEVTGLVMEREKIEYRHSDSKDFNKIAMPGMVKNNNITLKRGKFEKDFDFNTWLDEVANDRVNSAATSPSACSTKSTSPSPHGRRRAVFR